MDIKQKLDLFEELVSCGSNIYSWCYDGKGQLLYSNCPQEMLLATAFSFLGCKDTAYSHGITHSNVIIPGTALGLVWAAAFEKEGDTIQRMYLIGPVFTTDASQAGIRTSLKHYSSQEISLTWMHDFTRALPNLPVVSQMIFTRYAVMLHYCVTGEKLTTSDVFCSDIPILPEMKRVPRKDRHKVWQNEQVLLRMVREGDLGYKKAFNTAAMLSDGVPVSTGDPLRQAKTSVIVFTSLCTRAAIEGGLSPEEAYSLGDGYIQITENAATFSELAPIASTMYEDFVLRVRKCRTNPNLSRAIQKCCDYIEMHLEEKIRAKDLADWVGYTEYYLTRKFKDETGFFVSDYLKFARIERAKILLTASNTSIQDISEQLGFSSRSYFSRVFRDVIGCSPVKYRESKSY